MSFKKKKSDIELFRAVLAEQMKHDASLNARVNIPNGFEPHDDDDVDLDVVEIPTAVPPTIAELDEMSEIFHAAPPPPPPPPQALLPEQVSPTHSESVEGIDDVTMCDIQAENKKFASIAHRFKKWLGVRPGVHVADLEQRVRAENPLLPDAEVRARAAVLLGQEEKQKKSIHEKFIADEKVCRMLLRSYFDERDAEALQIYLDFQREHITRECGADHRRAVRRIGDVERAINTCDKHLARNKQTVENVIHVMLDRQSAPEKGVLIVEDVRDSLLATTTTSSTALAIPATAGALLSAQGEAAVAAMPGAVRTAVEFISAYTEDMTRTAEQVQQRHCEQLSRALVSAFNLTAALIEVATDDAVFFMDQQSSEPMAHPVAAMHRILKDA